MTEQMIKTWEGIGKFLGMSRSSVLRKYKASLNTDDPMPVHICKGICGGIVRAFPEDLLAWQGRYDDRLSSFKEIAQFLGMSTMTLYRKRIQEEKNGNVLPISDGCCSKTALKEWLLKQ